MLRVLYADKAGGALGGKAERYRLAHAAQIVDKSPSVPIHIAQDRVTSV